MAVMDRDRGNDRDRDSNKPSGKILKLRPIKRTSQQPKSNANNLDKPRRVASLDPYSFHDKIDIIEELTNNRDAYAAKGDLANCHITLYNLSSSVITCVDRIRYSISPRPGLNVTFACCIEQGLSQVLSNENIKTLIGFKERIAKIDKRVNPTILEAVANFFRSFNHLSISPSANSSTIRRQNLYVPEHVKESIGALCLELGLSTSNLVNLCIYISLAEQDEVLLDGQMEDMSRVVDTFYETVEVRRKLAEVMVGVLEEEVGKKR